MTEPDDASQADPMADGEEDSRDWRGEYLREAAQARKYRQRAQRAEAELTEARSRALTDEQSREYQQLLELRRQTAQEETRIQALEETVRRSVGRGALQAALAACGVGTGPNGAAAVDHAAKLLTDRIDVQIGDSEVTVRVVDDTGRPITQGADETPVDVRQFVAEWLTREGLHFLPASGDTGSGAHPGPTAPRTSIDALDRDPRRKAQFIATHGPQAYVQLARRTGR